MKYSFNIILYTWLAIKHSSAELPELFFGEPLEDMKNSNEPHSRTKN